MTPTSPTPKQVISRMVMAECALIMFSIVLGLFHKDGNPSRYFGEGRFNMGFSCLQLITVAWLSFRVFLARRTVAPKVGGISAAWLWAFIALGFVFLTADEGLEIHEHLDKIILKTFHLKQTSLTDRLDDALVGLYGVIGLAVLWLFRRELLTFKQILWPMAGGFICLFISVFCDIMSNDDEWIRPLFSDEAVMKRVGAWLAVGDGAFTLLGEAFFVAAFYILYRATKLLEHSVMA